MTVTTQINTNGTVPLAPLYDGYVADDWVFNFLFVVDAYSSTAQDMSAYTFSAKLVTPSTITDVTGLVGSVDATKAASGSVTVTIFDAYTTALTPDIESPDIPYDTTRTYYTRLHLLTTDSSSDTITQVITPIRKVRP